jgi:hypothetical protein
VVVGIGRDAVGEQVPIVVLCVAHAVNRGQAVGDVIGVDIRSGQRFLHQPVADAVGGLVEEFAAGAGSTCEE